MSLEQDVSFLMQVPLFRHFDQDQIKLVVFSAERKRFADGTMLYRQGERGSNAFIITSGQVAAWRGDEQDRKSLGQYGPGTVLGETAMIVQIERASNVQAVGDVEAISVSRSLFRRVLEEYPETAKRIYADWAIRLEGTMQDILKVSGRFSGGPASG